MSDTLKPGEKGLINKTGQFQMLQEELDHVINCNEIVYIVDSEDDAVKLAVIISWERYKDLVVEAAT